MPGAIPRQERALDRALKEKCKKVYANDNAPDDGLPENLLGDWVPFVRRSLLPEVENPNGDGDGAAHAQHGNNDVPLVRQRQLIGIAQHDGQHRRPGEQASGKNPECAARTFANERVETDQCPGNDGQGEPKLN